MHASWRQWFTFGAAIGAGVQAKVTYDFFRRNFELPPQQPAQKPPSAHRRLAIVVGGGVVGLTTAYQLCERGFRVRLLEAGGLDATHAASWGNAATLGVQGSDHTLTSYAALMGLLRACTTTCGAALYRSGVDHRTNIFFDPRLVREGMWRTWAMCHLRMLLRGEDRLGSLADAQRRHQAAQDHVFALADALGCDGSARMQRGGRLTVERASGAGGEPPPLSARQCVTDKHHAPSHNPATRPSAARRSVLERAACVRMCVQVRRAGARSGACSSVRVPQRWEVRGGGWPGRLRRYVRCTRRPMPGRPKLRRALRHSGAEVSDLARWGSNFGRPGLERRLSRCGDRRCCGGLRSAAFPSQSAARSQI
jgi:hypothetical protein